VVQQNRPMLRGARKSKDIPAVAIAAGPLRVRGCLAEAAVATGVPQAAADLLQRRTSPALGHSTKSLRFGLLRGGVSRAAATSREDSGGMGEPRPESRIEGTVSGMLSDGEQPHPASPRMQTRCRIRRSFHRMPSNVPSCPPAGLNTQAQLSSAQGWTRSSLTRTFSFARPCGTTIPRSSKMARS
jgi:hypothetical protein